MPSRSELERRLKPDSIRREFLAKLADHTKRDTVLFACKNVPIIPDDIQGFMAAFHELDGENLDLILHSSGGSSEATEQIVTYMRKKYQHIRAIIPIRAMSAATMLACACDEIIMGKHSAIGPIDPQFSLNGAPAMSAHAVIDDFNKALEDVRQNPNSAALWVPRFNSLPPGILSMCNQTIARSQELVAQWLTTYQKMSVEDGKATAEWLASYSHRSHGKPIDASDASTHGMKIVCMEDDAKLQDAVLSVFHAVSLSFNSGTCVKITENHKGKGLYQHVQKQQMQIQVPQQGQRQAAPQQKPAATPTPKAASK